MNLGQGVFVTGTDTGVGKTVVAAALARALRRRGIDAGVMKPFQTGVVMREGRPFAPDAQYLLSVAGLDDPIALVCPVMLDAPLAPSVAAHIAGRRVGIADVLPAYEELCRRHSFLVVEGAGGLAVPIDGRETMRDLAAVLQLPVLIVARPGLGTINHTALTVEYARAAGLEVVGVIISNYPDVPDLAEQTNLEAIEALTGVPVLGLLRHDADVDTETGRAGRIVDSMANHPLMDLLLARLKNVSPQ